MPRLKLNGEQEVRTMFLKLMRRRRRGEVYIYINTYEKRFQDRIILEGGEKKCEERENW